ncbi:nucleolar complex 2 and rad4-related [Anaeramoeba flamelloides]|uniref:Nucleolar complex 2 and rad4-related n=1 Tax=Anaeramoeba flamelloides TaxID=1746091 RepID=A0AAV7Y993_9EUKA|nr:nucleolar complex 2 and rad4-related [Anaeramoeba flamelloides]
MKRNIASSLYENELSDQFEETFSSLKHLKSSNNELYQLINKYGLRIAKEKQTPLTAKEQSILIGENSSLKKLNNKKDEETQEEEEEYTTTLLLKDLPLLKEQLKSELSREELIPILEIYHSACLCSSVMRNRSNNSASVKYEFKGGIKTARPYRNYLINAISKQFDRILAVDCERWTKYEEKTDYKSLKIKKLTKENKLLVMPYASSVLFLLNSCTDAEELNELLKTIHNTILLYFGYSKTTIQLLTRIVSTRLTLNNQTLHTTNNKKICYMILRKMSIKYPLPYLDDCVEQVFKDFCGRSECSYEPTDSGRLFYYDCILDLFDLDQQASFHWIYLIIFSLQIRIQAIEKLCDRINDFENLDMDDLAGLICTKDNYNKLGLVIKFICENPYDSKNLIPATVRTLLSFVHITSSKTFLPFKLRLLQLSLIISQDLRIYIPVLTHLCSILGIREILSGPNQKKMYFEDFSFEKNLKCENMDYLNYNYLESVFVTTFYFIYQFLELNSYEIAFIEISAPALTILNKFVKECTIVRWIQMVNPLLEKIKANNMKIQKLRLSIKFPPSDLRQADLFLSQEKMSKKGILSTNFNKIKKNFILFKPLPLNKNNKKNNKKKTNFKKRRKNFQNKKSQKKKN